MPKLPCFGGGACQTQADFAQQMMKMGFMAPPGPPPKGPGPESAMKQRPPGPPNAALQKVPGGPPGPPPKNPMQATGPGARPPGPPPKVAPGELPPGAKPPPPPPKSKPDAAASQPAAKPLNAATRFMPTTLRTKKPSQVAGGVLQASSASLSQDSRKRLLFTEAPKVVEKVNIEDAFQDFMHQLDD
ncbi:GIP [Symbiodinium pilosum]|uniref:GIP protein n=1 Tax=Symbiodinium pilosum TaxID=2952 RepID=A0A812VXF6_SYMPI|nr:GIP [Symbiodinium pilosum]